MTKYNPHDYIRRGRDRRNRKGIKDETRIVEFLNRKPDDECWIWPGALRNGYGWCAFQGRSRVAHRLIYELKRGEIPPDFVLDHLCCNKPCVNPDHLEAVTRSQNSNRGTGPRSYLCTQVQFDHELVKK